MAEMAFAGMLIGAGITKSASGAIMGLALGVAVSLGVNAIGWIKGDYERNGSESFLANLGDNLRNILGPVLAGALIGLSIGGKGAGLKGLFIGMTIGAAIGIFGSVLEWQGKKELAGMGGGTFLQHMLTNITGTLGIITGGAYLGWAVGKGGGAALGAILGVGISLFLAWIEWDKSVRNARFQNALSQTYGDIELTAEEIGTTVKSFFRYDVEVFIDNVNANVQSLQRQRNEIVSSVNSIVGKSMVLARIGYDGDASELGAEIQGLIGQINQYLDEQQAFVTLRLAESVSYTDEESGEVIQQIIGIDTEIKDYVASIGAQIGTILEDNIVDAVSEADMYENLVTKLSNVAKAITDSQNTAEFVAGVKLAVGDAQKAGYSKETMAAFAEQYALLDKQARQAAIDAVTQTYVGMEQKAGTLRTLIADSENPEDIARYQAMLEELEARIKQFDINAEIDSLYEQYVAEGRESARGFYKDMWTDAMEAAWKNNSLPTDTLDKYMGVISTWGSATGSESYVPGKMGLKNEILNGTVPIETVLQEFAAEILGLTVEQVQDILASSGLNEAELLGSHMQRFLWSWEERGGSGERMEQLLDLLYEKYGGMGGLLERYGFTMPQISGGGGGGAPGYVPASAGVVITGNNNVVYTGADGTTTEGAGGGGSPEEADPATGTKQDETNTWLQTIANKEFVIRPSAGLGRVVMDSIRMAGVNYG